MAIQFLNFAFPRRKSSRHRYDTSSIRQGFYPCIAIVSYFHRFVKQMKKCPANAPGDGKFSDFLLTFSKKCARIILPNKRISNMTMKREYFFLKNTRSEYGRSSLAEIFVCLATKSRVFLDARFCRASFLLGGDRKMRVSRPPRALKARPLVATQVKSPIPSGMGDFGRSEPRNPK